MLVTDPHIDCGSGSRQQNKRGSEALDHHSQFEEFHGKDERWFFLPLALKTSKICKITDADPQHCIYALVMNTALPRYSFLLQLEARM